MVITDFNVWDSKTYSFFVEDDLCEVTINKKKEHAYTYSCRINYEINTPLNARRRQHDRKNWQLGILFSIGIIAFALIAAGYFYLHPSAEKVRRERQLLTLRVGAEQEVQLLFDTTASAWYHTYNSWGIDQKLLLYWPVDTVTPAGWPLEAGDVFVAYRSKEIPGLFFIDLQQPSPSLTEKYRTNTAQRLKELYPLLSTAQVGCLLDVAVHNGGPRGLFLLSQLSKETKELLPVMRYCLIPVDALRQ